ncbi:hypothetical protein [Natribacillus halophilus]|uniref:Uncharacterized protein n=1 Tax=Natribacillus halophilus TaxID=549003 RepID=A0A1G8KXK3_9BACI|nr:hypothetical protein [Natribacillus halophilus]SDI48083.1 hypothetical protein SAMN04488123_102363 [Natribacillus halophilus]
MVHPLMALLIIAAATYGGYCIFKEDLKKTGWLEKMSMAGKIAIFSVFIILAGAFYVIISWQYISF